MNINDKYYYTIRSSEGSVVRVLRGDTAPKMTDGGGGWSVVARPRRTAMTQWVGRNPYAMDLPILFDGHHDGNASVESDIRRLNQMQIGDDFTPPPTVTIDGNAVPITGATWVIDSIDWGDDVYWRQVSGGQPYRTRQDAVIHLTQYMPEKRVKISATNTLPNVYIVGKSGETLRLIAKAMYGDGSKWTKIKAANPNIRDPNNLPIHLHVRVP